MAGKKSMCVVLFVMLMVFTNMNETVVADKGHETCCGDCYDGCSQPIGNINMACLANCFKECGGQCGDIHKLYPYSSHA